MAWPSVDAGSAAAQSLFARQVNATATAASDSDAVRFDMAALPAGWQSWTNLVAYTWPASSWIGMRVQAEPSPSDPPDGLARFVLQRVVGPPLVMGNRVQLAGAPELLGQPGASGGK